MGGSHQSLELSVPLTFTLDANPITRKMSAYWRVSRLASRRW